ncbi:hypothetical protein OEV98_02945 [Caldibacillus lycopersici]|uniref:Uncharacterized protein n=1 Tax=Perspicuibacillus lycopersici TaxID=1325689 RepID=A0AAE3LLM9_9BACI|nr:hypothetical protein [Perspicuibacillus lycopersici]MCU9612520.1 hypothetical protein [Perspicuibacillus lycopersici]
MKKYDVVEKKVTEYELLSVTCNKCGKTKQLTGDNDERQWDAEQFQSIICSFGYGSKFDMEKWSFDICEDCLVEFVASFKIKPEGFGE